MKIGLELEGFVVNRREVIPTPVLPLDYCPVDSVGSIVELRTKPYSDLYLAFGELHALVYELAEKLRKDQYGLDFQLGMHKFSPTNRRDALRHPLRPFKDVDSIISNLYGKSPKDWGSYTHTSLQINLSNTEEKQQPQYALNGSYVERSMVTTSYGRLFDYPVIIRALDTAFAAEIKAAGRQPGMYAIKDGGLRLEYRSLPSSVYDNRRLLDVLWPFFKDL